jgi:hypothetical protein
MALSMLSILVAGLLQTQAPAADDLRFLHPAVNLGELRSHVVRQHRFEFVNQGREPVEILSVEPSCGCVAVKLERRLFQPGERGAIAVDIKPTNQANGPHSWFAKVAYRVGQRQETAHLQIEAVVRHEVSVTPSSLVWSGSGRQEVTVTDLRDAPLAVTELHFTSPWVRTEVVSRDKGVTRIALQIDGEIPPGRHDEMLSIYTRDPVYNLLQVPVTLIGQVRKAVNVSPEQVDLRVAVGQPIPSTLFRLRPSGPRAVAIQSVSADDPAITCTWAQGPFNEATLKIQISASKLGERELSGTVRIQVREPAEEVITIPVRISH